MRAARSFSPSSVSPSRSTIVGPRWGRPNQAKVIGVLNHARSYRSFTQAANFCRGP